MKRSCPSLLRLGRLLVFSVPFGILSLCAAAPLDLGKNLTYLRLRGRPDDVTSLTSVWSRPALIVDLRYPAADAARYIPADLPARPGAAPLFVLISPATPSNALTALQVHAPALITLGLSVPGLTPDIAIVTKPENDRQAFDALDSGTSVDSLLSDAVVKPRFDEAALLHDRAQSPGGATVAPADSATAAAPMTSGRPAATATAATATPSTTPEPKDAVLLRAVQLDRTLLALGKLPLN
jgi:hypothetical protein